MPRGVLRRASHNVKGENTFQRATPASHYMRVSGIDGPEPRQVIRWKRSRSARLRQTNSHDAFSYMHVLDALMNSDPTIHVRARALSDRLNNQYPALIWDPFTVGALLAEIHDWFRDVLGDHHGLLARAPRDRDGHSYVLRYNQDTANLAYRVRDELEDLAALAAREQEDGHKPPTDYHAIAHCPSLQVTR